MVTHFVSRQLGVVRVMKMCCPICPLGPSLAPSLNARQNPPPKNAQRVLQPHHVDGRRVNLATQTRMMK